MFFVFCFSVFDFMLKRIRFFQGFSENCSKSYKHWDFSIFYKFFWIFLDFFGFFGFFEISVFVLEENFN